MNNFTLDLTIGIPVYNGLEHLRRLLDSIERELNGLKYEVIVNDDGSTDQTEQFIPKEFPWIKFFHSAENIGIGQSTDLILQHMQGQYLLRLDADTVVNRTCVLQMLEFMQTHPETGVLAPKLVDINGNFQPSYETHLKKPLEWFWDYFLWGKKLSQKLILARQPEINQDHPFKVAYLATAAVMIRRAAIDQVGGLDHQMEFFMEDADWIWRMHLAGWPIFYWPAIAMVHIGGQSGRLYIHCRDRSLKNLYYFYQKHLPGQSNQFLLTIAVLAGTILSLGLAIGFYLVAIFNPRWYRIAQRSIKSFANVLKWHISV